MFTGQHTHQHDAHSSPYCGKRYSAQCKVFSEHFMFYLVLFVGKCMLAKYSSILLLYFTHGLRQTWYSAHAMSLCAYSMCVCGCFCLSCNTEVSSSSFCALFEWSPECCELNRSSWCPPLPLIQLWQHPPPQPSKSEAILELPWCLAAAVPQEQQPHAGGPLAGCHHPQHPAAILGAQVLPLLAVISICFSHVDTQIVFWCCPCKTGTNTHAFTTTMGGRDRIWQLYIQSLNSQPLSDSTENPQVTSRNSSLDKIGQCHCWVTLQFTVWQLYDWYSLFCLDVFCQWG